MSWKAQVRRSINALLEPAGFTFSRFAPEIRCRHMDTPAIRQRQISDFKQALAHSLANFPHLNPAALPDAAIAEFLQSLAHCPVEQTRGGGGVNAALLLWSMARLIDPAVIVESGVFRGFTSWVLREASPGAEQYAFDITFAELKHRVQGVHYVEQDWISMNVRAPEDRPGLVYFDDHVDQWRRIREAVERGFRYLIFDDSLPANALHNDGEAAMPTVDMLFDAQIQDGEEIRWRTECGDFHYRHDGEMARLTRKFVKRHIRLPDLRFVFGYSAANLIVVELRGTLDVSD